MKLLALTRPNAATMAILLFLVLEPSRAASASGLIYVNRCAGGCMVTGAATDDAINGKSTLVSGAKTLSAFAHTDADFSATVSCLRSLFARYDVEVITTNPGNVARREMMLAGNATQVGYSSGTGGVAPFDGTVKDNVIAFTFANDIGADPDKLCWVAAAQVGALYGLEPEYYCADVTTYLTGCGVKTFADFAAPCGTFSAQATCAASTGQPT